VWLPWVKLAGVEIEVPWTLEMYVDLPSTTSSALLEPVTASRPIEADVPVKVKDTPVADHVNSFVAGLIRPRYRTAWAVSRKARAESQQYLRTIMYD
jgi:hypothetical protein